MSAPPPGQANGQARPTPPPRGLVPMRRKPRSDPLVARKKPNPKAAPRKPNLESAFSQTAPKHTGTLARPLQTEEDDEKLLESMKKFETQRKQNGGWTAPLGDNVTVREFPLVTTKRELKEGIRFHVMRFAKAAKGGDHDREIDPTDQSDFTRPVSLHRRDPRQPPPGRAVKEEPPSPPPVDDEDLKRIAQLKADREAQRALDQAQIAPSVKENAPKKAATAQKREKPINFFYGKTTDVQKKEAEVRYEEALPWHMEDADGKNVWVGSYVSALSEANVAFVIHDQSFRMVPLEKYYRFSHKPNFRTFTLEEAETMINKKLATPRWALADMDKEKKEQELNDTKRYLNGRTRVKQESTTYRSAPRSEKFDQDDIDMEGDEFQDDDENVGLEPENDEDSKDTRERMRRDHLGANNFGEGDERELDKEKNQEDRAEKERVEMGKQVRKALKNREFHLEYESDSDSDPFAESSSEEEKEESEEKKEKEGEDGKDKTDSKDKSGATVVSKTGSTPLGKLKPGEAGKKSKKRPGSPNLSESSGNESSRKKPSKKQKQAVGASALGSRAGTPVPGRPKASNSKGGALSEGEATAGEMSDGAIAKRKKLKVLGTGAKGTPVGSRAGSPVPSQGPQGSASGNASPLHAGSGSPSGAVSPSTGTPITHRPVEAWEIVDALRTVPEGMTIGDLLRVFGQRVGENPGQQPRKEWIKLVKETAVFGNTDKKLRPKN